MNVALRTICPAKVNEMTYDRSPTTKVTAPSTKKMIWYECKTLLWIWPIPYMMRLPKMLTQPLLEYQTRIKGKVSYGGQEDCRLTILARRKPCSCRRYQI